MKGIASSKSAWEGTAIVDRIQKGGAEPSRGRQFIKLQKLPGEGGGYMETRGREKEQEGRG